MKHALTILSLGFILYLYDGTTHKPVNFAPYHVFGTGEECRVDLDTWKRIAPEWLGACREEVAKK